MKFLERLRNTEENIERVMQEIHNCELDALTNMAADFLQGYVGVNVFEDLDINFGVAPMPITEDKDSWSICKGCYNKAKKELVLNAFMSQLPNRQLEILFTVTHELIHAIQMQLGIGRYKNINYNKLDELEKLIEVDYYDLTSEIDARIGELNLLKFLEDKDIFIDLDFKHNVIKHTFEYKDINRFENYLFDVNDKYVLDKASKYLYK